jgi:hypothetical protein
MPKTRTLRLAALLATAAALDTALAQDVVLSEVFVDGADDWIEIHNRGAAAADLGTWTLYLGTATPGQPGGYWWGFPPGTVLAPDCYLRVHWMSPRPPTAAAGELYTGETVFHFLFGAGGERLPAARGALALLNSQTSALMNSAASYEDWVSWGSGGLLRESLAIQAGRWHGGAATPAIAAGHSLARNPHQVGLLASPALEWFLDGTPTPLAANVGSAVVLSIGAPCAVVGHHLLGAPQLVATSPPVLGNGNFALRITNTSGLFREACLLAFTVAPAPAGLPTLLPPAPGAGCRELVDWRTWLGGILLPATPQQTTVPFGLSLPASFAGLGFHVQALVLDLWATAYPPYQGTTNALAITLGG